MLGGAKEHKIDENTIHVAEFAVTQLNGKANFPKHGALRLEKVLSAKTQVVAGTNHVLTIETSDDAGSKTVEVKVWEKLPSNVKSNESPLELTEYKLTGPVAEGNEQWTKAAQQGVAQLNQRSNSLFPYVLEDVVSATPVNDGTANTHLLVAVKRGDKHETFSITVKPSADDHYSLVTFSQQAPAAARS
jgi:hypothetical protein